MPQWFVVDQLVEPSMGQCSLPGGELTQEHRGGVLVQPGEHGVRAFVVRQVVMQGLQLGMNLAGGLAEQLV